MGLLNVSIQPFLYLYLFLIKEKNTAHCQEFYLCSSGNYSVVLRLKKEKKKNPEFRPYTFYLEATYKLLEFWFCNVPYDIFVAYYDAEIDY